MHQAQVKGASESDIRGDLRQLVQTPLELVISLFNLITLNNKHKNYSRFALVESDKHTGLVLLIGCLG